jgi:dTDP-4-dehydrorhamnose 3,5-epimerase-like enzyme
MQQYLGVKNCALLQLPVLSDARGSLCFCEGGNQVPFKIERVFWVYGTPDNTIRGEHAHRKSWQIHVAMTGSATIKLNDGTTEQEIVLDDPGRALLVGPLVWHSFELSLGAGFFVLTSNLFDEADYIRDFEEFARLAVR